MVGTLTVQTIQGPTSGANANKVIIPSGQTLDINSWTPPAGTVLQVQSYTYTGTWVSNSTNIATPIAVNITPTSASSKILIMAVINYDENRGNAGGGFRLTRSGNVIGNPSQVEAGNRYTVHSGFSANANADQSLMNAQIQFLDTPNSTSLLTYDVRVWRGNAGSYNTYINRARADGNESDDPRAVSTITVMEIAQ